MAEKDKDKGRRFKFQPGVPSSQSLFGRTTQMLNQLRQNFAPPSRNYPGAIESYKQWMSGGQPGVQPNLEGGPSIAEAPIMEKARQTPFGKDVRRFVETMGGLGATATGAAIEHVGGYFGGENIAKAGQKIKEGGREALKWPEPTQADDPALQNAIMERRRAAAKPTGSEGAGTVPSDIPQESGSPRHQEYYPTTDRREGATAATQAAKRTTEDVAKWFKASPESVSKQFDKLGGVEVIRGTKRTFFNPHTGEEYDKKREAVAGREGLAKLFEQGLKAKTEITKSTLYRDATRDAATIRADAQKWIADFNSKLPKEKQFVQLEMPIDWDTDTYGPMPLWTQDQTTGEFKYVDPTARNPLKTTPPELLHQLLSSITDQGFRKALFESLPEEQQSVYDKWLKKNKK